MRGWAIEVMFNHCFFMNNDHKDHCSCFCLNLLTYFAPAKTKTELVYVDGSSLKKIRAKVCMTKSALKKLNVCRFWPSFDKLVKSLSSSFLPERWHLICIWLIVSSCFGQINSKIGFLLHLPNFAVRKQDRNCDWTVCSPLKIFFIAPALQAPVGAWIG